MLLENGQQVHFVVNWQSRARERSSPLTVTIISGNNNARNYSYYRCYYYYRASSLLAASVHRACGRISEIAIRDDGMHPNDVKRCALRAGLCTPGLDLFYSGERCADDMPRENLSPTENRR